MANTHIVEFAVFHGADEATIKNRAVAASKVAGLVAQYGGQKIEDPAESVHITVWRTADSRKKFATSHQTNHAPLVIEILGVEESDNAKLIGALESPTTEVFTGYDALQSAFAAAVRTFTSAVDAQPPKGYHGAAVMETVEDVALSPTAAEAAPALISWVGSAVKLIIGWTSREAHLEAKAQPGPIQTNIGLLQDGRKASDLYHVKFQKLDSPTSE